MSELLGRGVQTTPCLKYCKGRNPYFVNVFEIVDVGPQVRFNTNLDKHDGPGKNSWCILGSVPLVPVVIHLRRHEVSQWISYGHILFPAYIDSEVGCGQRSRVGRCTWVSLDDSALFLKCCWVSQLYVTNEYMCVHTGIPACVYTHICLHRIWS